MSLREQTEARLVGFDELGAQTQVTTLRAIEADLRRALSAGAHPGTEILSGAAEPSARGRDES